MVDIDDLPIPRIDIELSAQEPKLFLAVESAEPSKRYDILARPPLITLTDQNRRGDLLFRLTADAASTLRSVSPHSAMVDTIPLPDLPRVPETAS